MHVEWPRLGTLGGWGWSYLEASPFPYLVVGWDGSPCSAGTVTWNHTLGLAIVRPAGNMKATKGSPYSSGKVAHLPLAVGAWPCLSGAEHTGQIIVVVLGKPVHKCSRNMVCAHCRNKYTLVHRRNFLTWAAVRATEYTGETMSTRNYWLWPWDSHVPH